ncbi:hypothetical protein yrohd0001_3360 [Yersinia rohdei ATCC 43380]|nr:hypothetical protein yrohd0001_3360 [Yersinia rohdei ATCC 43380]
MLLPLSLSLLADKPFIFQVDGIRYSGLPLETEITAFLHIEINEI